MGRLMTSLESLPGRTPTLSIIDSSKPFCANPSFLHLKGVRNQSPFPVHVSTEINNKKKKQLYRQSIKQFSNTQLKHNMKHEKRETAAFHCTLGAGIGTLTALFQFSNTSGRNYNAGPQSESHLIWYDERHCCDHLCLHSLANAAK